MSVEEIKNCTMGNAWELAVFAKEHDICVLGHEVQDVYDLNDDEDNASIAEIVGDILKCSKSKRVYDYLTENDLEQLKEAVLITLALGA